jgi:hypothetical protein
MTDEEKIIISKNFWDLKLFGDRNRQSYLENTDYLAIREAETGTAMDSAIKTKRQLARDEISIIRDTTNDPNADFETVINPAYESIKHLTKEF